MTIRFDADALVPRPPLSFAREALRDAFSGPGLNLLAAWIFLTLATSTAWAFHLRALVGRSSLANYWGEILTLRDLLELVANGGLKEHPFGTLAPLFALLGLIWVLWAGWAVQARAAGLKPTIGPWLMGAADALLIGLVPIGLACWIAGRILYGLASTGIQGLCWMDLVLGGLVKASFFAALFLQWWLCRIARAQAAPRGWRGWLTHLLLGFKRLWTYFLHWAIVVLGGTALRFGVHFLVFYLAWRLGGGTPGRVWTFLALQVAATLFGAWMLGWILRMTAHFWLHAERVRMAVLELEAQASSREGGQA